jgi:hypothetical protein
MSLKLAPPGSEGVAETYQKARSLFREGKVVLPDNARLIAQIKSINWKANPGGSISIKKPHDRNGGHCDICDAMVLALWEACGLAVPLPRPKVGTAEYFKLEEERMIESLEAKLSASKGGEWWEQYK